jgi:transcriptional regulator with XRE-family HTH domain
MDDVEMTVGQRIKLARTRARKTRAVIGGLVGKSEGWVKAVETGRLLPPRLPDLARIARALKVPLAELAGDVAVREELIAGPGHTALPAVREALNRYPLTVAAEPQPLAHIAARLDGAWRARHASPEHRTVLGRLLPDLIHDAQVAARQHEGAARRRAQAVLADVLGLTQMFVAYQPDPALLWRVAERAMIAAQDSGDLHAIAGATWFLMEAHRDSGDWDAAMGINLDALRLLEPRLGDADDDLRALFGALQAGAAFTAARAGEEGRAWRHWDVADRVARRLPDGYHQRWTWFSPPVVGFYAVSIGVELRKGGEALRHARRTPPESITSRPRRARHLIEVARAHQLRREPEAVLGVLGEAYATAPETIRWNGYARQMTFDLLRTGPQELRRSAADLAMRIGIAA